MSLPPLQSDSPVTHLKCDDGNTLQEAWMELLGEEGNRKLGDITDKELIDLKKKYPKVKIWKVMPDGEEKHYE